MKLVTVATYYEPTQARIALNLLESEGVHAALENEALLQNIWVLGQAVGHIRLFVLVTYVLFRIILLEDPLRPSYRKKLIWACILHVPVLLVVLLLIRFILSPLSMVD